MTTPSAPAAKHTHLIAQDGEFIRCIEKITESWTQQYADGQINRFPYTGEKRSAGRGAANDKVCAQFQTGRAACRRRTCGSDAVYTAF